MVFGEHPRDPRRGIVNQSSRTDYRTHKAEMAMVQLADHAPRLELAETVERERQIDIRLDRSVIESVAAVRLDQTAGANRVRNFAERVIAHLIRAVEIALAGGPQTRGRDQRNTRLPQRFRQTRARRRI